MSKVGIIGIGKIGSSIAFELLKNNDVSEIRIFNRNKNILDGVLASLQVASFQFSTNMKISRMDFSYLNDLDLIIIAVKEFYDPRQIIENKKYPIWLPKNLRYAGFVQDYPILVDVSNKISDYKGIVSVITNPIEMTTKFISDNTNSEFVFGLGASIDSVRIAFTIFNEKNVLINPDEILLFGEHGFKTRIVKELSNKFCFNGNCQQILDTSNSIGFNIVRKIGYTLLDCIPAFIKDINWLLNKNFNNSIRSFAYSKNNLILTQPIEKNKKSKIFKVSNIYNTLELFERNKINDNLQKKYYKILNGIENVAANKV